MTNKHFQIPSVAKLKFHPQLSWKLSYLISISLTTQTPQPIAKVRFYLKMVNNDKPFKEQRLL